MIRIARVTAALALLGVIIYGTGCGVVTPLGKDDFGCKGYEEGLPCRSMREVYAATDGPDWREATYGTQSRAEAARRAEGQARQARRTRAQGPWVMGWVEPEDQGKPILAAPQVLRVWLAPWEGDDGALRWPGYVFDEIRTERWIVAESEVKESKTLVPLQVQSTPENRGRGRPASGRASMTQPDNSD